MIAKSTRSFCALVSLTVILCYFGGEECVAAEASQPFAAFNPKVEIDIEDGEIEIMASFTLGAGSNGLDLAKDIVTLQLKGGAGAYSVAIPAGSFKKDGSGGFKFQGTINRVKLLEAAIRPARAGGFEFEIQTEGANLKGIANPITVSLTIGDHGGSKTVRAKIE
ncbi:MAG TPA: hypothetical protein VGL70_10180 [Candidatus Binatia bacterium]|jgi:hypothetical protein